MWPDTAISRLFGTSLPIVQAPMAGETDRAELTAAVSNAGGLGSIGAAYLRPEGVRAAIRAVRALTDRPFAVNLFIPLAGNSDPAKVEAARGLLAPWRAKFGLADEVPPLTMPDFEAQFAVVLEEKPAVFSYTFGSLSPDKVSQLKAAGIVVVGTATTVPEAERLEADGVDAVAAQGGEAGAHRGAFLEPMADSMVGLMALVPAMVDRVKIPVIAAGGIMDGRGIAAALALGAAAAQMGTAFLVSEESGAPAVWKNAILGLSADATSVSRVYSGRHARGIRNGMMRALEPHERELPGFPAMNALTRAIRGAGGKAGDADALSLWCGQAGPLARTMPARELVGVLARETDQTIDRVFRVRQITVQEARP